MLFPQEEVWLYLTAFVKVKLDRPCFRRCIYWFPKWPLPQLACDSIISACMKASQWTQGGPIAIFVTHSAKELRLV